MNSLGNFPDPEPSAPAPSARPGITPPPDPFLSEILGQPDAILRAAGLLTDQLGTLTTLARPRADRPLLVFTGMGASYHACYPAVTELADRGVPALHVDAAELLHFRTKLLEDGALVVLVSQSGESAEVVQLANELAGAARGPFTVSITNGLDNRLASSCDATIDTGAGNEGGPSTLTFAASLVTLAAVAEVLAGVDPRLLVDRVRASATKAAAGAAELLRVPEGAASTLASWQGGRPVTVLLGRGAARAASEMGALLVKETAGLPAEALQSGQFRHGPLELAGPEMAAIVFATEPETASLDRRLGTDLTAAGAAVLMVTADAAGEASGRPLARNDGAGTLHLAVDPVDRLLRPALAIVPVQLLAWRLALERGRTPGLLTRATKVTARE